MKNQCPLCKNNGDVFYQFRKKPYYQCNNCFGIFVDKKLIVSKEIEKSRYQEHNNDVNDKRFKQFVSPITSAILEDFWKENIGLDFGAGVEPVISKVLNDNHYNIKTYDPFFYNYPKLLDEKYDYIACCEVIEHFLNPYKEFSLLKKLLQPNGKLLIMTYLYNESIDFHNWNYKNDHTHIFIYHKNTIKWIKEEFGFLDARIEDRLITFSI